MTVRFYVGLHQPGDAQHFARACLSVPMLLRRGRRGAVRCPEVLLDSGAFTELALHGRYRSSPAEYAASLRRLVPAVIPGAVAAVSQDFMCEPFMLAKTGLSIDDHQRLTIERFDALVAHRPPVPIIPVLQGYDPRDYARHVRMYGGRLARGAWVGVGSICKRNAQPGEIHAVLSAIKRLRPDLLLHGFGVKQTSLADVAVRALLSTADSLAWSFHARRHGRDPNDWREARAFADKIEALQ